MFCKNCGTEIHGGKFCSECGAPIEQQEAKTDSEETQVNSVTQQGHEIKVCLNCGERLLANAAKCPSCNADAKEYPIVMSDDTDRIWQIKADAPHVVYKKSFWQRAAEQGSEINRQKAYENTSQSNPLTKKERIKENKANGIACCPKCGSTSLSANKKGFGIGKAVVGAALTGGIGLVAGNIGAKKVVVTCLNCGHQWKA